MDITTPDYLLVSGDGRIAVHLVVSEGTGALLHISNVFRERQNCCIYFFFIYYTKPLTISNLPTGTLLHIFSLQYLIHTNALLLLIYSPLIIPYFPYGCIIAHTCGGVMRLLLIYLVWQSGGTGVLLLLRIWCSKDMGALLLICWCQGDRCIDDHNIFTPTPVLP